MQISTITPFLSRYKWLLLGGAGVLVLAALIWQGVATGGNPDPTAAHLSRSAVIVDTGLLVFREGLEMILVLAAITASFVGGNQSYRRPVAVGGGLAFLVTIATWFIASAVTDAISAATGASSLDIQAATGILAIVVLVVIMNWFFHKIYWTGWIAAHNRRRRQLLAEDGSNTRSRILLGLGLLGFTSVYREGFEVVLFLQSLRLQYGSDLILLGVLVGLFFTAIVGALTFFAHHKLPYKRMLVVTGVMLGVVLLVMVGESVQEMQLAGWLPTTALHLPIPAWMGVWLAVFPNVQGLVAQFIAGGLVLGSYYGAEYLRVWRPQRQGETPAQRPETPPPALDARPREVSVG
jgi:high-affinity iron transporter